MNDLDYIINNLKAIPELIGVEITPAFPNSNLIDQVRDKEITAIISFFTLGGNKESKGMGSLKKEVGQDYAVGVWAGNPVDRDYIKQVVEDHFDSLEVIGDYLTIDEFTPDGEKNYDEDSGIYRYDFHLSVSYIKS